MNDKMNGTIPEWSMMPMMPKLPEKNFYAFLIVGGAILLGARIYAEWHASNIEFKEAMRLRVEFLGINADISEIEIPRIDEEAIPPDPINHGGAKVSKEVDWFVRHSIIGEERALFVPVSVRPVYRDWIKQVDSDIYMALHSEPSEQNIKNGWTRESLKELQTRIHSHDTAMSALWSKQDNWSEHAWVCDVLSFIGCGFIAVGIVWWYDYQQSHDSNLVKSKFSFIE